MLEVLAAVIAEGTAPQVLHHDDRQPAGKIGTTEELREGSEREFNHCSILVPSLQRRIVPCPTVREIRAEHQRSDQPP